MFHRHQRREIQGSDCLHKGGGSGNSERLQKESMRQSDRQFREQMALMQASMERDIPAPPKPQPTAAPPTPTTSEVARAQDDARATAAKRRGLVASLKGVGDTGSNKVGGRTTLLG